MSANVFASWTQNNANVTVNGAAINNSVNTPVPLNIGPNIITVVATMPTGTEIYTIVVTRVQGPIINIVVNPGPSTNIAVGGIQQFKATGYYQNNSNLDLTNSATWTSNTGDVATINPSGFASGVATGTAYISASYSGVSSPAVGLTVGTIPGNSTNSSISTRTETMAGGSLHNVGLKSDGTVVAAGDNYYGQCNVSTWTDITQVACGYNFTVGLKSDGTVIATGQNNWGQCDVDSWTNIIEVAAGSYFVAGLKSNGTVVAAGFNGSEQCDVGNWTGIVQISAFASFVVGLEYDGSVVATGLNSAGQCNVSSWNGIKQVTASGTYTVGLKNDGTIVTAGTSTGQDFSLWKDITQVAADSTATIGLKSDGSVVVTGHTEYGPITSASSWTGIIQLGTGWTSVMGLKADGTVIAAGDDSKQECTGANSWNLGCGTVTSIQGGRASVTQGDGVAVTITGANNQTYVTIGSVNNGSTSPSVGTVSLNGSQYYDVKVTPNSDLGNDALATITISNSSVTADSTIQYWYNNQWNTAQNIAINTSASPPTISGDVPVAYLNGTSFAIGAPTLNSITVTPNPSTNLAVGSTEQFTATGTYSDGSTKVITSKVTWASSDTTKATISLSGGLATGVAAGKPNITAALNGITSPAILLTVIPAATKTSGTSTSATYNTSNQAANLAATVTATGASVNEGTVTFTIQKGTTVIGSPITSGTVSSGNANAAYTLPGGTPAGTYTIHAAYNASSDFNSSVDDSANLVVTKANTTITGVSTTANYSTNAVTVNLVATVSSTAGSVNEGKVTFTIMNGNSVVGSAVTSGTVSAGNANVIYALPGGTAIGNYSITVSYQGGPDFNTSNNNAAALIVKKADQTFIITFRQSLGLGVSSCICRLGCTSFNESCKFDNVRQWETGPEYRGSGNNDFR